jgi:hypothetical protein
VETIVMRSFKFRKALQERNVENMLIIHDTTLPVQNWQVHAKHTQPNVGREVCR